jgi:hypothetical protein
VTVTADAGTPKPPDGIRAALAHRGALLGEPLPLGGSRWLALWPVDAPEYAPAERAKLAEARDAADLSKRIATLGPPKQVAPSAHDNMTAALGAVHGPSDLAPLIGPEGLEVVEVYEGAFARLRERLHSTALFTSPAAALLARAAGRVYTCTQGACNACNDDLKPVRLRYAESGGAWHLTSVELTPPRVGPITSPSAPRGVPNGDVGVTQRLAARLGAPGRVLGSAPLRADGSGSIGVSLAPDGRLVMLLSDGAYEETATLETGLVGTAKVGFVDSDGDGRTDVVVFGEAEYMKKRSKVARLFLSPREVDAPGRVIRPDAAALFALRGVGSLQAALDASLAVPTGPARKDACPLVLALGDKKTAPQALARGAKTWAYGEPGARRSRCTPSSSTRS